MMNKTAGRVIPKVSNSRLEQKFFIFFLSVSVFIRILIQVKVIIFSMFHAHRNHSSRLSPKRDTPLLPTRYASFGIKVFHYKCRKDTIISFIRQTISNFFLIRSSNYHQFSSISLHSTICTTCLMLQRPAFLPHVPSVQCSLPLYPM